MRQRIVTGIGIMLMLASLAVGQKTAEKKPAAPVMAPANQLADELARRMAKDLHVKTVVGEPLKVGSVTLIPIMMIDVSFGGAGMPAPSGPAVAVDGFYATGEARPLGFIAITAKGIRFISVGKSPAK